MHRGLPTFLLANAVAVVTACPVSAQEVRDPLPARSIETTVIELPADVLTWTARVQELDRWMSEFEKWQQWDAVWRGKREPGWMKSRERRKRPDPPSWLAAECRDLITQDQSVLAKGCRTLLVWSDDPTAAQVRAQLAAAQTQKEAPTRTVWWEHVHLDAMWPMAQTGSSVFGVLGVHATVDVAGRFQVFIAPGAIVLNVPTEDNRREWRPATDYGIAYRVADFTFPGVDRRATLHFNLAKAWVMGGPSNVVKSSITLAGFSVTFKKNEKP
jgi:hypothetical protein